MKIDESIHRKAQPHRIDLFKILEHNFSGSIAFRKIKPECFEIHEAAENRKGNRVSTDRAILTIGLTKEMLFLR